MREAVGGDAGGSEGTSSATPSTLQAAGDALKAASNACAALAGTPDIQDGGAAEIKAACLPTDTHGTLAHDIEGLVEAYLGVLVSGQVNFADAALDLYQVAGDFKTADTALPKGAEKLPPLPGYNGVAAYTVRLPNGSRATYYKDSSGQVERVEGGQAQMPGETYQAQPPPGS